MPINKVTESSGMAAELCVCHFRFSGLGPCQCQLSMSVCSGKPTWCPQGSPWQVATEGHRSKNLMGSTFLSGHLPPSTYPSLP